MANVYLARTSGPAGFHKWFAIKRIHPHLARDQKFVDMFLDEARIAAAIEHQNVAHVFDLGEADGAFFLAMEYLHGESLFGLTRESVRAGGAVSGRLAAYITARALDGLHFAHEATGRDGQKLNLVHRDVSPQNIFVTYDGQVKLTDFGVAKAANRLTNTETGLMKGKLAYASPEQLRGEPLDRRTDIFAMAICLWEITTGRRLFKGNSNAETLYKVSSGFRVPPSEIMADYPKELERIVARGLAHDRGDRYATAEEFARDLDLFVARTGDPIGAREVKTLMHALFREQIAEKDEVLKRPVLQHEETSQPSIPAVSQSEVRPIQRPQETAPAPTPNRWGLGAIILLAMGVLGGGLWWAQQADPIAHATVQIDTIPRGATVRLDGVPLSASTPVLARSVPYGSHRVMIEHEGHERLEEVFEVAQSTVELSFNLTATPEPVAPSPPDAAVGVAEPAPQAEPDTPERPRTDSPRATPERGRATLNLITSPSARVWVNGRSVGNTPLHRVTIPAGRVTLRMQQPGAARAMTKSLRVQPGETISRRFVLP
jgi:serine/threonine protein kinase